MLIKNCMLIDGADIFEEMKSAILIISPAGGK